MIQLQPVYLTTKNTDGTVTKTLVINPKTGHPKTKAVQIEFISRSLKPSERVLHSLDLEFAAYV